MTDTLEMVRVRMSVYAHHERSAIKKASIRMPRIVFIFNYLILKLEFIRLPLCSDWAAAQIDNSLFDVPISNKSMS